MEDLTGNVYNDLTAVQYIGGGGGSKGSLWEWKCVCGTVKVIAAHRVKSGHDLSCGCRVARLGRIPKNCRACGQPSLSLNRHGNFATLCQECRNKQTNGFKDRNPKVRMLQSAKQRARLKTIPFGITIDDFELPEYCPVLGVKLSYGNRVRHCDSPSLDKVIPSLGYVPGNVVVMSHRANWLKSNASIEELERVVAWLKENVNAQDEVK